MQKVYFDNAATTPIDQEVINIMVKSMNDEFGNPSSTHQFGRQSKAAIENVRKRIASYFNCSPLEVIFTAGGSEADNMVLFNAVQHLGIKRIISSKIEHHAVLHSLDLLEKEYQTEIVYLGLSEKGEVDLDQLEELLSTGNQKTMVSLMLVNNEIGNILDIKAVSKLCTSHGALFHSDTVQAIAHCPAELFTYPIDFMAASAHKFHGPKGVGFCIINKSLGMRPLLYGGDQEMGNRAGTENTHSIIGMGLALSKALDHFDDDRKKITELKSYFIDQLKNRLKGISFNGLSDDLEKSAFHILNVRLRKAVPMLLFNLDLKGIAASGGSACQSGSNKGSHVLSSILNDENARHTSVRFSLSKFNSKEEIDYVVTTLKALSED